MFACQLQEQLWRVRVGDGAVDLFDGHSWHVCSLSRRRAARSRVGVRFESRHRHVADCNLPTHQRGSVMPTAVIVDAIRTPLGRRNGKLKDWHPVDLAAETLKALIDRTGIDPGIVDDVVMGCVMQVGEQAANVARNAVLAAGWPETVPGTTIDRQCGSSQQAAHFAAQGVIAGAYDVVVAAGVEVMTRVPMGASMVDGKFGFPFGPKVGARYAPERRSGAAGHLRRADRRQVGPVARRPRCVRRAVAAVRRAGHRRGPVPDGDPAGAGRRRRDDVGRRGAARDDAGVAGQAEAGRSVPRRKAAGSPPATRRRSPTAPRRC